MRPLSPRSPPPLPCPSPAPRLLSGPPFVLPHATARSNSRSNSRARSLSILRDSHLARTLAALPLTTRGSPVHLGGDPKGKNFLYTNGRSVIIRDIENPAIADVYTEHLANVTVAKYAPSGYYIASGGKTASDPSSERARGDDKGRRSGGREDGEKESVDEHDRQRQWSFKDSKDSKDSKESKDSKAGHGLRREGGREEAGHGESVESRTGRGVRNVSSQQGRPRPRLHPPSSRPHPP